MLSFLGELRAHAGCCAGSRCLLALAAEGGGDRRECGLEIRAYNFNGADDNHGNQSEAEANGEFADR